jgi:hypothetical protein
MTAQIRHSDDNLERVYLVGVRLAPGSHEPDVYTLVLYNEVARQDANRPLTHDGRIVFFKRLREAGRAMALGDIAFRKYSAAPNDVAIVYDVPSVIQLVERGDRDDDAILADFLNELLDFVAATKWPIPSAYIDSLHALADRTTFDKEFGDMLDGVPNGRSETRNALSWCLGTVLSNVLVLN